MRKLLFFMLMLAPFLGHGQNYFTEGMEWTVKSTGTDRPVPPAPKYLVYTIEKCMDGDTPALGIFYKQKDSTDESRLYVYIMTEGEKVYFKLPDSNVRSWYLMYDFGLKPGEGCFFYTPFTNSPNVEPQRTYLKCLSVGKEPEKYDEDWEIMTLEEYVDYEGELLKMHNNGIWIKGLASASGVTDNNQFNRDGGSSKLMEASLDGNVIYKTAAAGVTEIQAASPFQVRVDGLEVYVSGIEKADTAMLYTDGGVICGRCDLLPGSTAHLRLPDKGVYILTSEAGVCKIIAQ